MSTTASSKLTTLRLSAMRFSAFLLIVGAVSMFTIESNRAKDAQMANKVMPDKRYFFIFTCCYLLLVSVSVILKLRPGMG